MTLNEWIEREFAGHGRAVHSIGEPPLDGEPWMSMAEAKELTRRAVQKFARPRLTVVNPAPAGSR